MATIVRLAPGHTQSDLQLAGLLPVRAEDNVSDGLFVVKRPQSTSDEDNLNHQAALASWGYIRPQTANPSLLSCNYRLSDNPAAVHIVAAAGAVMVTDGIVTQEEFNNPLTILLLTDDPTNSSHMFAVVSVPDLPGAIHPDPLGHSRTEFVATLDRMTFAVLSAGRSHWHDDP